MIRNIFFIIALTFPVATIATSFSIEDNEKWGRNLMFSLILALGQGVMYSLGSLLGGTFMHIVADYSKWIILGLCFIIAFRMILDIFKIKKGSNLFLIEKKKHLLLLSIALGINTFIAGLMADFFQPFGNLITYLLIISGFIWSIIAIIVPFSKIKLIFNSLLNLIFAIIILIIGLTFVI